MHGRLPRLEVAQISPRAGGQSALLTLAVIAVVVLARPVTALADHGSRHDRCDAPAGAGYGGGSGGDDCPVPAAAAAQPAALPGPSPLPTLPTPAPTAPALLPPGPAARPDAPAAGMDPRSSLIGGAALAGLALLVASGFRARRRLRRSWDEGVSDPGAV